jgi:signal transduction histidine kinase
MKSKISDLSKHYLASLRTYLEADLGGTEPSLSELGNEAVSLGLETLDLAKIHEFALSSLVLSDLAHSPYEQMKNRAEVFFKEAIVPIEKTHRAALETDLQLHNVSTQLNRRTQDLADSKSALVEQKSVRKNAELTSKNSEVASQELLRDSHELEEHLQEIVRKVISANEEERKKMSLLLHDEIAQTLLGIHVRLHALKRDLVNNSATLMKKIATIQNLVGESDKITNRLTLEFDKYDK